MVSGGSGLRELARRSSVADSEVKPTQVEPANQANVASSEGSGFNAPGAVASKPLTVPRQARLPLAPLQRVTFYEKRSIAQFLPFTDAVALMLASTDMHHAIQAKPPFRLQEQLQALSASFGNMGCNDWLQHMRSLDAEILRRQADMPHQQVPCSSPLLRPDAHIAGALPHAASLGILFADYCCKLMLARSATQAHQASERSRLAGLEALASERSRCAVELQAFEGPAEDLVFHFASERLNGTEPRQGAGAGELSMADLQAMDRQLIDAMRQGDVEWVRAGLREFLGLPPLLMPSARKLARLVFQPGAPLQFFGQQMCGSLKPLERRQYEAVMACTDEIVSAGIFSSAEEAALRAGLADVVRGVVGSDQPAAVASLVDGLAGLKLASQRQELKLRMKLAKVFEQAGHDDLSAQPSVVDAIIQLKSFVPTRKRTLQMEVESICRRATGHGSPGLAAAVVNEIVNSTLFSPSEEARLHVKLGDLCERVMGSGDRELAASVREAIARSGFFSPPEEMQFLGKLTEICRNAMRNGNPAAAASILLGIHESSASPGFKHACLAAIGDFWHGGMEGYVDFVSEEVLRYQRCAPDWVTDVVARLQGMKQALPAEA